jgi:hypothetical protein
VDGDGEVGPLALHALVRGRVTVLGTDNMKHRPDGPIDDPQSGGDAPSRQDRDAFYEYVSAVELSA